jgi:sirohydrochlorin cobaltochelatase
MTLTSDSASTNAIILFAHGSRDPLWHKPMEAVAARIRANAPDQRVSCAYLELSQPDLPGAVADWVAQGCDSITIVPMFLGVGRHAREDLPLLVADLHKAHPRTKFILQSAVGEDPRLVQLLAEIALDKPKP